MREEEGEKVRECEGLRLISERVKRLEEQKVRR